MLRENKIEIEPTDEIIPSPDSLIGDGAEIVIKRGFNVAITAGTQKHVVKTNVTRVKDLLIAAGITFDGDDRVTPGLEELIEGPVDIVVTKVEKDTLKEELPIPFKIEYRSDSDLAPGERRIISEGNPGVLQRTTVITFEDGREVAKDVAEKIIKPADSKIIALGRKLTASRDSRPENYKSELVMVATGYSHTGNMTATDTKPRYGVAAVDPEVIPLNTKIYIEGYGHARAEDTGGAIKGNRIDLFFETRQEALDFGRKKVRVYIIE